MKTFTTFLLALAAGMALAGAVAVAGERSRIYGTLMTVDGESFEGYIRWDKNEGCWHDVLDGTKRREAIERSDRRRYRDRDRDFFGIGISFGGSSAQSGIAFGHISRLEPLDDNAALLTLKSGQEIELEGGSTDIGDDMRELVIEDPEEGEIEFDWDDIEFVEFRESGASTSSLLGPRLYGSVTTRRGDVFTGYISWDVDESFGADVLDGYESGRKRKIRFSRIKSIERHGSDAATVRTTDGDEMRLSGTNDVDGSNSGIVVSDPKLGRIVIRWDEFELVEFSEAPENDGYDIYDGGKPIYGTVTADDGSTYTGEIIWDNDERWTWEILDGEFRRIEMDVFFANIASIERHRGGALVTLGDGREFYLRDSNDVDDGNKGIFVRLESGDVEEIEWDFFERLDLK
ncbi:MAG TPA: hypothetical protein VLB27_03885 [candidate division Zixibacteria bacterium]|nr:hypothetical protein [candidate division Zixibacteria bacterium]